MPDLAPLAEPDAPARAALQFPADVELRAAGPAGRPTFSVLAYSGGLLRNVIAEVPLPVVVDLASVRFPKSVIATAGHVRGEVGAAELVGHVTGIRNDRRQLHFDGIISGPGVGAAQVLDAHRNGFPWQVSIQATDMQLQPVPAGEKVTVNGRTFEGPIVVARKALIYRVAFTPQGADPQNEVAIAASAAPDRAAVEAEYLQLLECGASDPARIHSSRAAYLLAASARTPADFACDLAIVSGNFYRLKLQRTAHAAELGFKLVTRHTR